MSIIPGDVDRIAHNYIKNFEKKEGSIRTTSSRVRTRLTLWDIVWVIKLQSLARLHVIRAIVHRLNDIVSRSVDCIVIRTIVRFVVTFERDCDRVVL
jgi:hypothetical protein